VRLFGLEIASPVIQSTVWSRSRGSPPRPPHRVSCSSIFPSVHAQLGRHPSASSRRFLCPQRRALVAKTCKLGCRNATWPAIIRQFRRRPPRRRPVSKADRREDGIQSRNLAERRPNVSLFGTAPRFSMTSWWGPRRVLVPKTGVRRIVVLPLTRSRQSRTTGQGVIGPVPVHHGSSLDFQVPRRCSQIYCSPRKPPSPPYLPVLARQLAFWSRVRLLSRRRWCGHGAERPIHDSRLHRDSILGSLAVLVLALLRIRRGLKTANSRSA
jgi:hypothetical protein